MEIVDIDEAPQQYEETSESEKIVVETTLPQSEIEIEVIVNEALPQSCEIEEIVVEGLEIEEEIEEVVNEALPQSCEIEEIVVEDLEIEKEIEEIVNEALPQSCEIDEIIVESFPQGEIEEIFDEAQSEIDDEDEEQHRGTMEIDHDSRRICTYWNEDRLSYYLTHERKWLIYAIRLIPSSMGFAVLSLPYAMSKLSLAYGVRLIILSWIASLCTMRMLVVMHEVGPDRVRLNSYVAIAEHAFGDGWLLWAVKMVDFLGRFFTNIVHHEVAGQCLQMLVKIVFCRIGKCYKFINFRGSFILLFGLLQCLLSILPNNIYDDFRLKLGVFCCILSYCIIICCVSLGVAEEGGLQPSQTTNVKLPGVLQPGVVYGIFIAMSQIAFAFTGHYEVAGVQKEVFSTVRRSQQPMWKAVMASYLLVVAICLLVAVIGCWRFGDGVKSNVVLSLEGPLWLLATTYLLVVLQLAISCQMKAKPATEQLLLLHTRFLTMRNLVRIFYMLSALILAIILPLELGYMAVAGGLCNASISYLFPCLMWINIHNHKSGRPMGVWFLKWICVPISAIVIILSTVGGAHDATHQVRHYKFFQ